MTVPQYNLLGRASYGETVLLSLYAQLCTNFRRILRNGHSRSLHSEL